MADISRVADPLAMSKGEEPMQTVPHWREAWVHFRHSRIAVLALGVLLLLGFAALLAPWLAPYSPTEVSVMDVLQSPNALHWWGTDDLGRDVYSGALYGLRISMAVGLMAGLVAAILGTIIGALAGFLGGWVDALLMRITDFILTIPVLFLALVLIPVFGSSRLIVIFVIGGLAWPSIARLVRAEFLKLRSEAFVEAARGYGARRFKLIFSEILPNTFDLVLVSTALQVPAAILIEAGLSFLGVGDPEPRSLGLMLKDAYGLLGLAWWSAVFPGLVLSALAISLNLVADAFNDAVRGHE
ncbi:ABC transporter permease [Aminobacter anthyllidis]|uniref:ABC transporter permease n=1 Tax=Aminobacter anthyllidis TaxID=1035067 RepID=A0A9X1D5J0_9HYPH|nr:ABC transporter permease [Aminobacter anthyllidis]MBT1157232.1 ABC transporter permease [Aminobacter anthyllidis]